jgi:hypothetical protein
MIKHAGAERARRGRPSTIGVPRLPVGNRRNNDPAGIAPSRRFHPEQVGVFARTLRAE